MPRNTSRVSSALANERSVKLPKYGPVMNTKLNNMPANAKAAVDGVCHCK